MYNIFLLHKYKIKININISKNNKKLIGIHK